MTDFEITHIRKECIGCGMCASIAGKYWKMDSKESKANLVGGKETAQGSGIFKRLVKNALPQDLEINKNAQDTCPVKVIKVK